MWALGWLNALLSISDTRRSATECALQFWHVSITATFAVQFSCEGASNAVTGLSGTQTRGMGCVS